MNDFLNTIRKFLLARVLYFAVGLVVGIIITVGALGI